MSLNLRGLQKISNGISKNLEKASELKKLANRKNYTYKVAKLKERLTEEVKFWINKGPSAKLDDLQRDIKFIASIQTKTSYTSAEEARISLLVKKYPID